MRVGFVEWPEALEPFSPEWDELSGQVLNAKLDMLVTNELPFGRWVADHRPFGRTEAQACVDVHARGLDALKKLKVPAIISSRPVWSADRLINQAIAIEKGQEREIHTKQYIPEEPGFYEASWFTPGKEFFKPADVTGLRLGVMLCTDAMFNEHARNYGRSGTALIAILRAAGTSTENWLTAGRMAALVSGNYVVSSNRYGRSVGGTEFGATGFAFSPSGTLLASTDSENRLLVVDVDPAISKRQQREYPCYLTERNL